MADIDVIKFSLDLCASIQLKTLVLQAPFEVLFNSVRDDKEYKETI